MLLSPSSNCHASRQEIQFKTMTPEFIESQEKKKKGGVVGEISVYKCHACSGINRADDVHGLGKQESFLRQVVGCSRVQELFRRSRWGLQYTKCYSRAAQVDHNCYQRGLQMAKVISYPKEIAIAFNTISNKRTAIPLFPIRTINL